MEGRRAKSNAGLIVLIIVLIVIIGFLIAGLVITGKEANENNKGQVVSQVTPVPSDGPDDVGDNTPIPSDATDAPDGPTAAPTAAPTPIEYKLVDYSGKVEHVFTHSLIAFPELAYTGSVDSIIKSTWFIDCITVKEFKAVLEALYKDGYMLINLNDIYEEVTTASGGVKYQLKSSFKFPEGKKPLVFSFDDTNYYASKAGHGMVDKLIIVDGKITTYTKMKDGTEVISDEGDYIPIIDKFVEEHPDFSFNGAKGMICVTGFDGVLGYRTHRILEDDTRTEADRQKEIEAVAPVVQLLKDTGWYFACHSYKHGSMANYSKANMLDCATKFKNEVTPIIGETKIYVYPYGSWMRSSDGSTCPDTQAVLNSFGFQYFCSVGVNWYTKTRSDLGNIILQDRANIDGTSLVKNQDLFTYVNGTSQERFPSLNFREIFDEARGMTYDEAVAAYKKWKGIA